VFVVAIHFYFGVPEATQWNHSDGLQIHRLGQDVADRTSGKAFDQPTGDRKYVHRKCDCSRRGTKEPLSGLRSAWRAH
jgi:hypothetical protein